MFVGLHISDLTSDLLASGLSLYLYPALLVDLKDLNMARAINIGSI